MMHQIIATAVVCLGGALMIAARRFQNKDTDAGSGIAFGAFLIIYIIWMGKL